MSATGSTGGFRKLDDRYSRYAVEDSDGEKIGSVDATYVNEVDQREYVAVSGGIAGLLPGTSSTVLPLDICTVENNSNTIVASTHRDTVKNAPSLSSGAELTPELEAQVRNFYRL